MPEQTLPAAEFQKLPLDYLIASPLIAAVNAQRATAETTKNFIMSFLTKDGATDNYTPQTVKFLLDVQQADANGRLQDTKVKLDVPLLSIVPVPHLRIDSLTTHFKYEVNQVVKSSQQNENNIAGTATAGLKFLPFLNLSLNGSLSSRSAEESSTNRSGTLEITVHASEAPIPEGLSRLLSMLAKMAEPRPTV